MFSGGSTSPLFWDSKQNELIPALRVEPATTKELSIILTILVQEGCQFAIKSGGNARGAGSSSTDGGVLIDPVRLNGVVISEDRNTVNIGAGAKWIDVYSKLDPYGITVMGGRVSMVGAGGFLLGGKLTEMQT